MTDEAHQTMGGLWHPRSELYHQAKKRRRHRGTAGHVGGLPELRHTVVLLRGLELVLCVHGELRLFRYGGNRKLPGMNM